jgi:hypothetical protein
MSLSVVNCSARAIIETATVPVDELEGNPLRGPAGALTDHRMSHSLARCCGGQFSAYRVKRCIPHYRER